MPKLSDLLAVAIVSGICASVALACFWWAGREARLAAAIASAVASAMVVVQSRSGGRRVGDEQGGIG